MLLAGEPRVSAAAGGAHVSPYPWAGMLPVGLAVAPGPATWAAGEVQ